jgi:hypothetical protein
MAATKAPKAERTGCRTNPIPSTLSHVRGYPQKLVIYQLEASPYWWVRYYASGKILRKSTKETDKSRAYEFAKQFFNEILLRQQGGQTLSPQSAKNFAVCAQAMLKAQADRLARGEITKITHDNDKLRLNKHVLPFFGKKDVADITYRDGEDFLATLTNLNLSSATLGSYMGLVKKVLGYAHRNSLISSVPQLPLVKRKDQPRGWFTTREYRALARHAVTWADKSFYIKTLANTEKAKEGGKNTYIVPATKRDKRGGKTLHKITISPQMVNVITFMVNAFVRPTDLKVMQHKHVEVVDEGIEPGQKMLKLDLPITKEHDGVIVTMQRAVDAYRRQIERTADFMGLKDNMKPAQQREVMKDHYVFFPENTNRDAALKDMQVQFNVIATMLGYKLGPKNEERTMYSLRHTCIMYRLLYGGDIDHITLARNARTSPEMIDRFYAKHLKATQNADRIQSRRKFIKSAK